MRVGKTARTFDLNLKIDYGESASLKLNPKTHATTAPSRSVKLAATMGTFGMMVPVLRDRGDNVVAGHAPVLAPQKAVIGQIPTILIDHLTPEQLGAFATIADNKLHDLGEWDDVALVEE